MILSYYKQFSKNPGKLGNWAFSPDGSKIAYAAGREVWDHAVSQAYVMDVAGGEPVNLTPPEFKGHHGIWTPEDLFVSSLVGCFMTTFLGVAERRELAFEKFDAEAEGVLARPEGEFLFTEMVLRPKLVLPDDGDKDLAHEVLELAKEDCLVSHSVVSEVRMEAVVRTAAEEAASAA